MIHTKTEQISPPATVEDLTHLVAEVKRGNVQALRDLGIRLLLGDNAPHHPAEGVGMLVEACQKGDARAAARLSVLHALGLHVRQGWQLALHLLAEAAERGDGDSAAQLRILARVPDDDRTPYAALGKQVDLDAWVKVPGAVTLSESPLVRTYPDFVPPSICRWLIARAQGRLTRARVYDAVSQEVTINRTRTNSVAIFNLAATDLIQLLVQARMAVCTGVPFRHMEASSVLHYSVGQTITNHYDFIDPKAPDYEQQVGTMGQRIITFLVYLNDDYTGGATGFPQIGLRHKGRAGEGLFFVNVGEHGQPDLRTLHAGEPPESGEKWIVSQFIRDRPVF